MRITESFVSIQGEGPLTGSLSYFLRLHGCNKSCQWCIEPSQRVFMSDYTWKPIADITIGDRVIGLDFSNYNTPARFVPSTVTNKVTREQKPLVKVSTSTNSILCTPDHKFYNVTWGQHWTEAKSMNGKIVKSIPVYDLTDEFWKGWLCGVIVGDGWFHWFKGKWLRFGIGCKDEEILQKVYELLTSMGMHPHWQTHNTTFNGNISYMNAIELTRSSEAERLFDLVQDNRYHDEIIERSIDEMRGFLAGIVDSEGYINQHRDIRISQKDYNVIRQICYYLDKLNFKYAIRQDRENLYTIVINELMRFTCTCRPLLHRKRRSTTIRSYHTKEECVVMKLPCKSEVIDITTDTGNFICEGFVVHNCDTKYSWDHYIDIPVENVADSIRRSGINFLVITGGEPTLQLADIYTLLTLLEQHTTKLFTTLETNGTKQVDTTKFDLIMVSPKEFSDADPWWDIDNAYLKFVVDSTNIASTIDYVLSHSTSKPVYFMPQSRTIEEMIENSYIILHELQSRKLSNILLCSRLQLLYGIR